MKSNAKAQPKTAVIDPNSADFKNVVDLLAVLSESNNRLAVLAADTNGSLLEILDDQRDPYATAQAAATQAEAALEQIARSHPEWFAEARSVKTPYGTISLKSSTKLEIANEEATMAKLELLAERRKSDPDNPFVLDEYVRTKLEPNKEALEKLDDATLLKLGIARVTEDNFKATPAKLDMGKAVKEAAERKPLQQAA